MPFSRSDNLLRHKRHNPHCSRKLEESAKRRKTNNTNTIVPNILISDKKKCDVCNIEILPRFWGGHLRSQAHKAKAAEIDVDLCSDTCTIHVLKSAFRNRIISYKITPTGCQVFQHARNFLLGLRPSAIMMMEKQLEQHTNVKINVELFGKYYLATKEISEIKSFNSKYVVLWQTSNLEEVYDAFIDILEKKASEFSEKESGWGVERFLYIEINFAKYNPLRASSYIPLPQALVSKKAIINIKNEDQKCFLWSVLAHLHPVCYTQHPQRSVNYIKYESELNMQGIEYPVKLRDISKFELLNEISINVYGWDDISEDKGKPQYKIIGPLYYTRSRKDCHVNLLLITNSVGDSHYCLIRNMSRLVSSQINSRAHRKFFCDGCLISFTTEDRLNQHQQYDCNHVVTRLPDPSKTKLDHLGDRVPEHLLKFENYKNQFKAPFVIYADFEAFLQSISHAEEPDLHESFTLPINKHVPYSFGYYIKCSYDDNLSLYRSYRGEDCVQVFLKSITKDVQRIWENYLNNQLPLPPLTVDEERSYENSKKCYICGKDFDESEQNKRKVRDHCHASSKFNGAAHSICNLNYKPKHYIPCFFHNLTNYDCHLFVKELGETPGRIEVIAQNKEKYISFSKQIPITTVNDVGGQYVTIRFLDSFRFMASSLDTLSRNLSDDQCGELARYFPDPKEFMLLRHKGVFPYSYVDSMEKLEDTELPTYEQFYDKLKEQNISEEDYARAQQIWEIFNCPTLGFYSDLYLKVDVLLLNCIFESFRKVCYRIYGLDPANYMTAPALTWDAMLKYTGEELELLTDIDMMHFVKKGIRGGISQCSVRRAVANNPFLSDFNPSEPTSYLMYLDACNLYGAAMSQYLPKDNFRWLSSEELSHFHVENIPKKSSVGYIIEADIDYPTTLHDSHNELPFCAELIIPPNSTSKIRKLIPNLLNKEKYIIHYSNLKHALKHGLIVKKIYRVLEFTQSPWLKPYIDLNTINRNHAKNKFEKDFYKLMVNSIFGKTIENVDKRVDVKLCNQWEPIGKKAGAQTHINKPQFKNLSIFTENLCAIQLNKSRVDYFKPTYVGFCVLEISKLIMYTFYYDFIKARYGDDALLLYMDTDSLILFIKTDNVYKDILENIDLFDTSNYPPNNCHNIPTGVSVIGKMKDEYAGRILSEVIGTGSKAYIVNCENHLTPKAKGIPYHISKTNLDMDCYRQAVDNENFKHIVKFNSFRSRLHTIYTEMRNKVALSYFDNKRILIPNSYLTYAWGHHKASTS